MNESAYTSLTPATEPPYTLNASVYSPTNHMSIKLNMIPTISAASFKQNNPLFVHWPLK